MQERTRNITVGITALAGLAGLAVLLMLFGQLPSMLETGYQLRVELPTAGGLREGSRVKLSGIDVGRVVGIEFQPPPERGVAAVLRIDQGVTIPRDAQATVMTPILTGSPYLAFDVRELSDRQLADTLATDGSAVTTGKPSGLFGDLSRQLNDSLEGLREDIRQPMERFARMEERFNALSREWEAVGTNINDMLERRSVEQVEAGEAQANLSTLIERSDQRMAEMRDLLESMHQWLATAHTATDKIGTAAEDVSRTAERVGASADEAKTQFQQLSRRYIAVADDLSGLLAESERLVRKARDGDGTMGRMLNDPQLYDNFNDSIERVGEAVDELRLMIEKWNAEGVPIQF